MAGTLILFMEEGWDNTEKEILHLLMRNGKGVRRKNSRISGKIRPRGPARRINECINNCVSRVSANSGHVGGVEVDDEQSPELKLKRKG